MQILSSEDMITSNRTSPFIDIANYTIINTVPYNKQTNTPMPYKNIVINAGLEGFYGKKSFIPYLEKQGITSDGSFNRNSYANIMANNNSNTSIIDNNNPNITYVIGAKSSVDSSSSALYVFKYVETDSNISCTKNILISSYNYSQNRCSYITQDENYIYALVDCTINSISGYTTSQMRSIMFKINKETLSSSRCYCSEPGGYGSSKRDGSSYFSSGYFTSFCKVLKEVNDGLIMYSMNIFYTSYNSSYEPWGNSYNYDEQYLDVEYRFYSFNTNRLTRITYTRNVQGNVTAEIPFGSASFNNSYNSMNATSPYWNKICVPSECLETDTQIYYYIFAPTSYGYSNLVNTLFLFKSDKSDVMSATVYNLSLVFPEGSEISSLPASTDTCSLSTGCFTYLNARRYETQVFNIQGIDYVNLWIEGIQGAPVDIRGCYTFKINQDKTEATFVSYMPVIGGATHGFMPLNDVGTKILVTTPTSYHIMIFDVVSESWKPTFESMTALKSIVKTDDDKIYALTDDNNIICQDLNGATVIDFNFEKLTYQYNDVDINTYIEVWSKNSEDKYVATNVKLTLQGNAVWQANGLQTINVTTSVEGKLTVPFVIKGQSTINVSVDVIL